MKKQGILFLFCFLFIIGFGKAQKIQTLEIAEKVLKKGLNEIDLGLYPGSLLMHGMSEFALTSESEKIQNQTIRIFKQFKTKEIEGRGNFISYEPGGSGAAYLSWLGAAPELDNQVEEAAHRFFKIQKRSSEGLMTSKHAKDSLDQVFIDVAFAVTPFLLYSGLKLDNREYIDFAVFETLELFRILEDKNTGLLHQARGFNSYGKLTEDNWSRGNGWGAFALAILIRDLPVSHPKHEEIVGLAQKFFSAVIQFQNKNGLWHQEMSDPSSYVETSGSGLLLYGLGIMLEKKHISSEYINNFERGLMGYLTYIGLDGSVHNTCRGCLCPGNGTKEDYKQREWILNDPHSFGPVVLAFTQAHKIGVDKITLEKKSNYYSAINSPFTPKTYVTSARGSDVAWENDRIAFRVFGPEVREKVGSGVDVWAKSVSYPILEKWYKLNEQGQNYQIDRGEGCDFYDMGKHRGCGGLAIWVDGKPHTSETYDSFHIKKNESDGIVFSLDYKTWNVPGLKIQESKIIEMPLGTNLFKVTSTLKSNTDRELTVAIGLTTYGKPEIYQSNIGGILSAWEQIDTVHGSLGTAILINPEDFVGFASHNGDEFILIKGRTKPSV